MALVGHAGGDWRVGLLGGLGKLGVAGLKNEERGVYVQGWWGSRDFKIMFSTNNHIKNILSNISQKCLSYKRSKPNIF